MSEIWSGNTSLQGDGWLRGMTLKFNVSLHPNNYCLSPRGTKTSSTPQSLIGAHHWLLWTAAVGPIDITLSAKLSTSANYSHCCPISLHAQSSMTGKLSERPTPAQRYQATISRSAASSARRIKADHLSTPNYSLSDASRPFLCGGQRLGLQRMCWGQAPGGSPPTPTRGTEQPLCNGSHTARAAASQHAVGDVAITLFMDIQIKAVFHAVS